MSIIIESNAGHISLSISHLASHKIIVYEKINDSFIAYCC